MERKTKPSQLELDLGTFEPIGLIADRLAQKLSAAPARASTKRTSVAADPPQGHAKDEQPGKKRRPRHDIHCPPPFPYAHKDASPELKAQLDALRAVFRRPKNGPKPRR